MKLTRTARAIGLSVGLVSLLGLAGCSKPSVDKNIAELVRLVKAKGVKITEKSGNVECDVYRFRKMVTLDKEYGLVVVYLDFKPTGLDANDLLMLTVVDSRNNYSFEDQGLNGLRKEDKEDLVEINGKRVSVEDQSNKNIYREAVRFSIAGLNQ